MKEGSNNIVVKNAEENSLQEYLSGGFVIFVSVIGAALLQLDWLQNNKYFAMCLTFLFGYIGIVFETYFEFNKAGIALIMSTALWVIYSGTPLSGNSAISPLLHLSEKVSEVSEVIYFLLGAMTIVEIVDAHHGFKVVTDKINSKSKRGLMWVIGVLT